jgi:ABC-2 type transport system permease protein
MKLYPILVRREFWEHRALWITPLAMAALWIATSAFMKIHMGNELPLTVAQGRAILNVVGWGMSVATLLVVGVVVTFYLLDSLYAERRDRSILFWKSLPVSDAATVLAKLAVAMVIVPLLAFVVVAFTDLIARALIAARGGAGIAVEQASIWDGRMWWQAQVLLFIGIVASVLWYAPLAAYLLVMSAWARRSVMLWAVLPPLVLMMVEGMVLRTTRVWEFLSDRLSPAVPIMRGIEAQLASGTIKIDRNEVVVPGTLLDHVDLGAIFLNAQLLLGLLAAAVLVFVAIRMRRYRDET